MEGGGRNPFWETSTCPRLLPPLTQPDAATLHGLYSGEGQERDSLDMATEQDDCYIVRFKRLEGGRRGLWRR